MFARFCSIYVSKRPGKRPKVPSIASMLLPCRGWRIRTQIRAHVRVLLSTLSFWFAGKLFTTMLSDRALLWTRWSSSRSPIGTRWNTIMSRWSSSRRFWFHARYFCYRVHTGCSNRLWCVQQQRCVLVFHWSAGRWSSRLRASSLSMSTGNPEGSQCL